MPKFNLRQKMMAQHDLRAQFNVLIQVLDAHRHEFMAATNKVLFRDAADNAQSALLGVGIPIERIAEGLTIQTNRSSGSRFFYNDEAVLKVSDLGVLSSDFAVITSRIFYSAAAASFQDLNGAAVVCPELDNHLSFLHMKAVLCAAIGNEAVGTGLMSYHDETEKRMVMISGTKGVLAIGYEQPGPRFDGRISLRVQVARLSIALAAKGYPELLKQEVYDALKNVQVEKRLEALARGLHQLLDNSDGSYDVYMSNFSMESLKDKLRQEKAKYYGSMREVLSKVYSQITATTVAASASAIAGASVQQPEVYLFIAGAYLVYAVFVTVLLHALQREVAAFRNEFEAEKTELINKSKLPQDEITKEVAAIGSRFKAARNIIIAFRWTFLLLTAIFAAYITWRFVQARLNQLEEGQKLFRSLGKIVGGFWSW